MYITSESAAEVMRLIALIRKGTKFPGKLPREEKTDSAPTPAQTAALGRIVHEISTGS